MYCMGIVKATLQCDESRCCSGGISFSVESKRHNPLTRFGFCGGHAGQLSRAIEGILLLCMIDFAAVMNYADTL